MAILTITANAQSKHPRFGIEAAVAAAIHVGKFGDKDFTFAIQEEPTGAAKTGVAFDIKPGYYFNKQARVFLLMGLGWNARDKKAVEKTLRGPYTGNDISIEVKSDDWLLWKLMPGFSYSFESSDGLIFRPHAAAGVMFTKWPKLSGVTQIGGIFDPNPPTLTAFTMAAKELPVAFAYQVGATGSFPVVKNEVYINLDLNFFSAVSKETVSYMISFPTPGPFVEIEQKYKFATVNVGVGIEFRF